jgi:hypothetical protein
MFSLVRGKKLIKITQRWKNNIKIHLTDRLLYEQWKGHRCKYNIKMTLKKIVCTDVN